MATIDFITTIFASPNPVIDNDTIYYPTMSVFFNDNLINDNITVQPTDYGLEDYELPVIATNRQKQYRKLHGTSNPSAPPAWKNETGQTPQPINDESHNMWGGKQVVDDGVRYFNYAGRGMSVYKFVITVNDNSDNNLTTEHTIKIIFNNKNITGTGISIKYVKINNMRISAGAFLDENNIEMKIKFEMPLYQKLTEAYTNKRILPKTVNADLSKNPDNTAKYLKVFPYLISSR